MRIGLCHNSTHPLPIEQFTKKIRALGKYEVKSIQVPDGSLDQPADEILITAVQECDALWVRAGYFSDNVLSAAKDLKAIQTYGSGFDHIDVESATNSGVMVSHNPEVPAPAVAEHVIGLMLSLLRRIPSLDRLCEAGGWTKARTMEFAELSEQTVGVVGVGTIGFRVCNILRRGFEANVIAHDPYVMGELESDIWPRVTETDLEEIGVSLHGLSTIFERSDIITLHVPLTPDTLGFIDESLLSKMNEGYLINASRGKVLNEAALKDALDQSTLSGAALDVLTSEPPDPDNDLLRLPNVYVTPHVAGTSETSKKRAPTVSAQKIHMMLQGNRTPTMIN